MSSLGPSGAFSKLKYAIVCFAIPYLAGWYIMSSQDNEDRWISPSLLDSGRRMLWNDESPSTAVPPAAAKLYKACPREIITSLVLGENNPIDDNPLEGGISLHIHRNGDAEPCGTTAGDLMEALHVAYSDAFPECPTSLSKYQVESLLTRVIHSMLVDSCVSVESDGDASRGFLGYCDMGPKKTPILLDHADLIPIKTNNHFSLPCHFHTREGLRISQLSQFIMVALEAQQQQERPDDGAGGDASVETQSTPGIHLYSVPAGRVFMFAPKYVGEIFHLPHVEGSDQQQIYLEVLSLEPRVFDVFHFFSREESQQIVDGAIAEGRDSHKIKRSTTGASGHSLNSRRTSESGFDTHGRVAVKVKKRCFKALGFDEYWESHGDGLQILRYNLTTAYNSHLDYFEDKTGQLEHDHDSSGVGGNRFATILMYMSDLGPDDGGETVFTKAWPPEISVEDRVDTKTAIEMLRDSERGTVLKPNSWEEDLVAKCRTRLAIRPHSSRAVLFYSQHPNGEVDRTSLHGACPVLAGQKYAANLWVWNTPRAGYAGAPIKEKFHGKNKKSNGSSSSSSPSTNYKSIRATFRNTGRDPKMENAKLYFRDDQFWGDFGVDIDHGVNTFDTHVWTVKVDGEIVKTFVVSEEDGLEQEFTV